MAPWAALIFCGAALEATWLWFYLRPFSLIERDGAQLSPEPFVPALPVGARGLGVFLVSWLSLFALFGAALALTASLRGRRFAVVSGGFGLLFALTLWPTIPLGSTDLYHYILDGRALALHGGNPLAAPPGDFWQDRLAFILYYNTENTGAYGPLFYTLAAGAARLAGDSLAWSTVSMKGVAVLWLAGCLPLVYAITERLRPGHGGGALIAFAWNPLVLFETAGSGHNDIGVAFFGLLALWLAISGRWRWAPAAIALGVLVKPTAALLLPPLLAWLWFQPERARSRDLLLPLAGAVALMTAAYVPFWAGAATFSQLRHLTTLRMNSPADLAIVLLVEQIDAGAAVRFVKLASAAAFLVAAGAVLLTHRGRRPELLMASTFWCLFAYLMLASWWFWPWYLVPLIAVGATLWPSRAGTLAVIFSCTALLLYAALGWRETLFTYSNPVSQAAGVALAVFVAPALVWASGWLERGPGANAT